MSLVSPTTTTTQPANRPASAARGRHSPSLPTRAPALLQTSVQEALVAASLAEVRQVEEDAAALRVGMTHTSLPFASSAALAPAHESVHLPQCCCARPALRLPPCCLPATC